MPRNTEFASNDLRQGYLKVLTPETTDGRTPKINTRTGRIMVREDHLPLSALKQLEKKNLKLEAHLRKEIITVMPERNLSPKAPKVSEVVDLKNSSEDFEEKETDDFEDTNVNTQTKTEVKKKAAKKKTDEDF